MTGVESVLEFKLVNDGRVKAVVSLRYGDFVIKGFKIVDPGEGKPLWVGMPRKQLPAPDGSGETHYVNVVSMPDSARRRAFETYVLKAYREELKKAGSPRPRAEA